MRKTRIALAALLLAGSSLLLTTPGFAAEPHGGGPRGGPGGHGGHAFSFAHRDFAHFSAGERSTWLGGRWNHGWHNGRFGWWWFAGGAWYFYDAPVYPYPGYVSDDYVDDGDYAPGGGAYWYYCSNPAGYYPYVQSCGLPWQPVPAAPPPQGPGYGPPAGYQGPGDQPPPPGYQQGPGNPPPPGYQGPGPGDQPPPGYQQGPDNGPGPGDQPPPGYQGGPNGAGQGYPPPPPNSPPPPNGYNGPNGNGQN